MRWWLVVFVLLAFVSSAGAVDYPKLSGFVTDKAGLISPEWEANITALAKEIEENTTAEFAVVTVPSLEGASIEQYAVELFEREGIGKEDKDNGVLILIAKEERRYRVEVGYGLEAYITDSMKVSIGRDIMEHNFRQGDFGKGVYEAMDAMYGLIQGNPDVLSEYRMKYASRQSSQGGGMWDFIIFIFIIFMFSRMTGGRFMFIPFFFGGPRGRGRGYGGFGGGGFGGFGGGLSGGGGFGGRW